MKDIIQGVNDVRLRVQPAKCHTHLKTYPGPLFFGGCLSFWRFDLETHPRGGPEKEMSLNIAFKMATSKAHHPKNTHPNLGCFASFSVRLPILPTCCLPGSRNRETSD